MPTGDGPFQVLAKINDNAYKIYLQSECSISPTFNVADLVASFETWTSSLIMPHLSTKAF